MDEYYFPDDYAALLEYLQSQYSQPVYQEPVYAPPMYEEPVYTPPVYDAYQYNDPYQYQEPVYQQPVYDPYQYQEPVYQEPVYQEPVYEPVYQEPVYQPPVYQQPVYQEPVYTPQYMVDDYGLIGGGNDQYTPPQISNAQAEADRAAQAEAAQAEAAQAEAQRVASERAMIERYAAEQAAAQAEAQRIAAAQAEAQRYAAEQAEAQRIAAEQAEAQRIAAAQAQAAEQARVQAAQQARVQAEAQRIAAEQAQAAEQARVQAEAQRVAAEQAAAAEAQRVAAEQELAARVEAERVASAQAAAAAAAAQRQQTEMNDRRAQAAQAAAERAAQERALAEQAAAQAAEQARAQAEAVAQAQAAEQARVQAAEQARAQAEAQAAEQSRVQAEAQAAEQSRVQAEAAAQAEAQRVAAQPAAPAYQEPAYTPPVDYTAALGDLQSRYEEPVYQEPVYQEPVYQEPVYQEPAYTPPVYQEPAYTPAVEPVTQELVYQEPAYTPPVYEPPVYNEPAYTTPSYNEPMTYDADRFVDPYQYTPPAYQEPAYTPPVYQEPYVAPVEQPYTPAVEPTTQEVAPVEQPYTPAPNFDPYQYIPAEDPYVAPNTAPLNYGAPVYNEQISAPLDYGAPVYNEPTSTPYVDPYQYIPAVDPYVETPYTPTAEPTTQVPAPVETPYTPAVEPTTPVPAPADATMPYTLNGLSPEAFAGLYALSANNAGGPTGSGIEGLPSLGAGYTPLFEEKLITAPVSNKGNPTAYSGMDNQFYMSPNDFVRLVDRSTNTVVFEGTGYEAAQKAVEMGQNMTDTMGRKADYQIQTGKTQDSYVPVANEKFNKTDLQNIAGAVGTALPLALAFVPGLNLGVLGSIGAGAGVGGASAALKGENILKGAAIGGLSAAGGQVLGPIIGDAANVGLRAGTAIGTGLGSTAGGLVTGQSLKDALLSGVVSGGLSYIAPDITKELGIGGGGSSASSTSGGGSTSDIVVTGSAPASIGTTLGGSNPSKLKLPEPTTPEVPYDGLTVTGDKLGNLSGINFVGDQYGAPTGPVSAFDQMFRAEQPVAEAPPAEPPVEDIIKVTGERLGAVTPYAPPVGADGSGLSPEVINQIGKPAVEPVSPEEILVQAREAFNPISVTAPLPTELLPTGGLPPAAPTETISPEEILVEARKPPTPSITAPALSPEVIQAINEPAQTVNDSDIIKVTGERPGAVTPYAPIIGVETPMPELPTDIVVDATKTEQPTGGLTLSQNTLDTAQRVADMENAPAPEDIVVTGNKTEPVSVNLDTNLGTAPITGTLPVPTPDPALTDPKKKLGLEEYLRIAGLFSGLIGGGGKAGQAGTYTPGGRGLNPIFSAKLPSPSGFAVNRTARPMGDVDWLTYGTRPELNFFDYAMRGVPAPITKPIPNNPAGPSMYAPDVDNMRFAKGGAAHAGQPPRTEFAVNGPGTGRSDDIPAVLSDGEYVIDAETVALLGDGSNKAGAKKLDELRVKVRKHKGKKLAKGRFSANAKKPEAYLSGGRI